MGGRSSWLTAVKKAFAPSNKEKENHKVSSRRREDHREEGEGEEKERSSLVATLKTVYGFVQKSGKRRWLFRRPSNRETNVQHCETRSITPTANIEAAGTSKAGVFGEASERQHKLAIAVAMSTAAAAQAEAATAQAAVEVFRLPGPSLFAREHSAALLIQTTFRGYLVRRMEIWVVAL